MFKYREFPIFSKDRQRSCLLQVSCNIDVVPASDIIGTSKAMANDVHYTVYSKYTESYGRFSGDIKHYNYYSKASEAARKINSFSYNTKYNDNMRKKINTRNINNSSGCEKIVYQYDLQGNLLKIWDSVKSISRELGYKTPNISACCLNKRNTAYEYKWTYKSL